jgi:pimeloyl-ACP methyl ester carboxylesterase
VPYLARHFRVVTYDGPGNGLSDRPLASAPSGSDAEGQAEDFVALFFDQCFPEPHSTKQVEDCVGWGLETTPQVLIAAEEAGAPDEAAIRHWCSRAARPALVIHGDQDRINPLRSGAALARATGGNLVVLEGAGHIANARDPVRVNRLIREFAESLPGGPG